LLAKSDAFEQEIKDLQSEKEQNTLAMKAVQAKYDDIEKKFGEVLTSFESYIKEVELQDGKKMEKARQEREKHQAIQSELKQDINDLEVIKQDLEHQVNDRNREIHHINIELNRYKQEKQLLEDKVDQLRDDNQTDRFNKLQVSVLQEEIL
jgi:chromosome segregation ATPase